MPASAARQSLVTLAPPLSRTRFHSLQATPHCRGDAKRPLINNLIPFGVITLIVFVGLDDGEPIFAAVGNRMRESDPDVMRRRAENSRWANQSSLARQ